MSSLCLEYGWGYLLGGMSGTHRVQGEMESRMLDIGEEADEESLRMQCAKELYEMFHSILLVRPREWRVLLVEPMLVPSRTRQVLMSVLLDTFKVQGVCMQPNMHMSMLASGLSSGVMIVIGKEESMAMAFEDGRPVLASLKTSPLGMMWMEHAFSAEVQNAWGVSVTNESSSSLLHEHCKTLFAAHVSAAVADEPLDDVRVGPLSHVTTVSHVLSSDVRSAPVTRLLQGCLYSGRSSVDAPDDGHGGDELGGLAGLLLACLSACEVDVRAAAVEGGVVLCGPGARIPHMTSALCRAAEQMAMGDSNVLSGGICDYSALRRVIAHAPGGHLREVRSIFPHQHLSWVGGSLFATVSHSKDQFIPSNGALSSRVPPDWLFAGNSHMAGSSRLGT